MAQAPETVGAIYSCRFCGIRHASINASFTHRCPNVTAPTLDSVTDALRNKAKVRFDWVRVTDEGIKVTMPDHTDQKNATKPYQRAQNALMSHGWKIARRADCWIVRV